MQEVVPEAIGRRMEALAAEVAALESSLRAADPRVVYERPWTGMSRRPSATLCAKCKAGRHASCSSLACLCDHNPA